MKVSVTNSRMKHFFRLSSFTGRVGSSSRDPDYSYTELFEWSSPMCSFLFRTITFVVRSSLLFSRKVGSLTIFSIFSWSPLSRLPRCCELSPPPCVCSVFLRKEQVLFVDLRFELLKNPASAELICWRVGSSSIRVDFISYRSSGWYSLAGSSTLFEEVLELDASCFYSSIWSSISSKLLASNVVCR